SSFQCGARGNAGPRQEGRPVVTAARKPFPNDPTACLNCGGDGIERDWRNHRDEVEYELCDHCGGSGRRQPTTAQRVLDAATIGVMGFIFGMALLGSGMLVL